VRSDRSSAGLVVLAAVALLVGVGLGRFGLQSDLREAEAALVLAEARSCDERGAVGRQIARALEGRPVVEAPPPEIDRPVAAPDPDEDGSVAGDGPSEVDDRAEFEAVADTVALRRAQARQALIEQAQPSEDQLDRIDEAFAVMNDILIDEAEVLLESVHDGQPARRVGLEFARNSIDALLDAEDAVLSTLSDEQVDQADPEALDPLGFIDPELVEVLIELER